MHESIIVSTMEEEKRKIKLIGSRASPFVNRVQMVLKLKCIEYELVEEDLTCKSELLLTSNPVYKKIPVLIHGNGPPLVESRIIMEYIDETFPDIHPILPSLPSIRAYVRFCAFYFDNQVIKMYDNLMVAADEEEKEKIKMQIIESSQLLEQDFAKCSNGKSYFGGDDIGYLDIVIGSCYVWTKLLGKIHNFKVYDEARNPQLSEWAKRICSHETFNAVVTDEETFMTLYKMRRWLLRNRPEYSPKPIQPKNPRNRMQSKI